MSGGKPKNWGWRDFWKHDRLAACIPEHGGSREAIARHWQGIFADVGPGTRILDVATGNGVVLTHAAAAARTSGTEVVLVGVDLADIDPVRFVPSHAAELENVRFIGRVSAEALPFEAGSFDLVVSQYGLEYADVGRALAEVSRVLVPGGRLRWLAHGRDSAVVAQNRDQRQQIDFLLATDGPVQAMHELVISMQRASRVNRYARRVAKALQAAELYCRDHPPAQLVTQICTGLRDTLQSLGAYRPEGIAEMLRINEAEMQAHRARISDLLAANLDASREARVGALLQSSGWQEAEISPLHLAHSGNCLGLDIRAHSH